MIDIVVLNRTPIELKYAVITTGTIIYEFIIIIIIVIIRIILDGIADADIVGQGTSKTRSGYRENKSQRQQNLLSFRKGSGQHQCKH